MQAITDKILITGIADEVTYRYTAASTSRRGKERAMGYSQHDVREGRSSRDRERTEKLWQGDLIDRCTSERDGSLAAFAEDLEMGLSTARDRRRTARACTSELRAHLDECGVHVTYSILRDGSRTTAPGQPHDPDFRVLRAMIGEAHREGKGKVSYQLYRQRIGIGPTMSDILSPLPSGDGATEDILNALMHSPDRDKIIEWAAANDELINSAVHKAAEAERESAAGRQESAGNGAKTPGGHRRDEAAAMAEDLQRLSRQATGLMNRYPRSVAMAEGQRTQSKEAALNLYLLLKHVHMRTGIQVLPEACARCSGTVADASIPAPRRERVGV